MEEISSHSVLRVERSGLTRPSVKVLTVSLSVCRSACCSSFSFLFLAMCSEMTGRTLCQFHLHDHLKYYPYLEMTETKKIGFRLPLLKRLNSEQYPVEHHLRTAFLPG